MLKEDFDLSTRERIMHMLKTSGELTAKDITEQLGITGMAVRRHLAVLEKDRLVESSTIRLPLGRPTAVYRLTETAEDFFPKKYHAVALDLLSEIEGEAGEEYVNHLFDLRQASLQKRLESELRGKELETKVASLAELQTNNGYMATWQKNDDGDYELIEYNCPIYQVANKYKHACTCELRLFESLLGAEVSRTECLAKDGKKCVYRIRQSKSDES